MRIPEFSILVDTDKISGGNTLADIYLPVDWRREHVRYQHVSFGYCYDEIRIILRERLTIDMSGR